ncbi:STAS domain-containing protein [Insolitispirillum peregrinum]|uniref:STAS domain-containing protein n=1 Tax=Insolitispirillum peregrinum TaxID=80876 RepID=UPI00360DC036
MVKVDRNGSELRVVLTGRQTLAEAEGTRDQLMAALLTPEMSSLVLDCTSVSDLDVSFLQLLLAARKMGQARSIAVSLSAPAAGPLADTLARAGLARPGDGGKGWFDPFWAGGQ